jgi:hypothetical protein
MPMGKMLPRAGLLWASIAGTGRGTLAPHDKLNKLGATAVSGELTCLPLVAPLDAYRLKV